MPFFDVEITYRARIEARDSESARKMVEFMFEVGHNFSSNRFSKVEVRGVPDG